MGINTQKYIFLLIFICVNINAQEIVNETIDTQVSASSLSQDAQKKIDNLDIKSKESICLRILLISDFWALIISCNWSSYVFRLLYSATVSLNS